MQESTNEPVSAIFLKGNIAGLRQETDASTAILLFPSPKEENKSPTSILKQKEDKAWNERWIEQHEVNAKLLASAEEGNVDATKKLLDNAHNGMYPDINAKGLDDYTPLHLAVSEEHFEVIYYLLSKAANVNSLSVSLKTPLHIAACRGNSKIIELLLCFSASINAQDKDGNTPAHILAELGRMEPLSVLLKNNPDLNIRNMYKETPADIATTVDCFKLLQQSKEEDPASPTTGYTRTVVDNLILHNGRADMIKSLMFKTSLLSQRVIQQNSKPTASREKYKNVTVKIVSTTPESTTPSSPTRAKPEDFVPIQLLGKGSFGEVYLAKHKQTGKQYAVKILSKKQITMHNLMKYAKAERNILSYSKHPFIVGIEYAFQNPESLFLVLEYCPGGDLSEILQLEKRFSESRARSYAAEILLAIEELHRKDIIFRDLKPGNVVLDADGHAMLTDFGLSKEGAGENLTKSFCGTAAYMAPEILKKSGHGKAVDWYLFGTFIYEMLVGSTPYYADNKKQLYRNIVLEKLILPSFLSEDAKKILEDLLEKDPAKRLGSGRDDAEAVKRHIWFKTLDWDVVASRGLKPPKPVLKKGKEVKIAADKFYNGKKETNKVEGWSFVSG